MRRKETIVANYYSIRRALWDQAENICGGVLHKPAAFLSVHYLDLYALRKMNYVSIESLANSKT